MESTVKNIELYKRELDYSVKCTTFTTVPMKKETINHVFIFDTNTQKSPEDIIPDPYG